MKFYFRCLAWLLLLNSHSLWSSETFLHVFYQSAPLKGVDVKFDGSNVSTTDSFGRSTIEVNPGQHIIELEREDKIIAAIKFDVAENQDLEINVRFSDESVEPVINIQKFNLAEAGNVSGVLSGRVTDRNNVPIGSAKISVANKDIEVLTNDDGTYKLELPRGLYKLTISHPDFIAKDVENIRVFASVGVVASVKLKLPESSKPKISIAQPTLEVPMPMEEVIALGTYYADENTISIERFSTKVVDAIDIATLERFGDSTAAAALTRIVGVSVSDGKYANVRGLDGRYISNTLNGFIMPGTDPFRREVQLDLFPTNIIGSVEIQKSYSPDLLGATTGGNIKIITRGLPEEQVSKFSISTGYNTDFTGDDIVSHKGSSTDWTGYDSGLRDLSDNVVSETDGAQSLTICTIDPERCTDPLIAAGYALSFEDDYNVKTKTANPDFGISYSYGDNVSLSEGNFGFYGAAAYKYSTKNRGDGELSNPFGLENGDFSRSQENINLSAYFITGYEFKQNDEILSKTIFLRDTDDITRVDQGVNQDDQQIEEVVFQWVEREFVSQQFTGIHEFNFGNQFHQLDWRLGYSQTNRYEPDRRTYQYINGSLSTSSVERRWSDLNEDSFDFGIDYLIPFSFTDDIKTDLKIGGLFSDRSRKLSLFRFGITSGSNVSEISFSDEQDLEQVLSYENFILDRIRLRTSTAGTDSYNSDEEITAYYLSTTTEFGSDWTLVAGIRQEDFTQDLEYPNQSSADNQLDEENPLPSITLTYRFQEDIQVRTGWSKTISYPGIVERAESLFYDEEDRPVVGNPELEISKIDNFDIRFEYYFSDEETVSIAYFRKEIDSPAEQVLLDGSGELAEGSTFRNAVSADLNGIEIDVYKNIIDTDSFLIFIGSNISYIDSEVELDTNSLRLEGESAQGRELQGQSPWLANLQLGLDHHQTEQKLTLVVNYFDDRIDRVGRGEDVGPEFEVGRVLVDLNYEKLFSDSLVVKAQIKNLLNEDITFRQNEIDIRSYKEGVSFSLSASYEF